MGRLLLLGNVAYAGVPGAGRLAQNRDCAGIHHGESEGYFEERGFSGTIWPKNREILSLGDGKVEVIPKGTGSKSEATPAYFYRGGA